ncbi:MAG: alpha-L-rhamnosidase N-terminal domain-containing protein, partial [Clostridia bacterium]|nr:alpha-L-rhamnosidase N-terminal domain-containing protein [Clostridia bacterium]
MRFLATIVSYIYIAIAFISSLFSWGSAEMVPFRNDYTIPESIPEYQTISVEEKTDWTAKWIWDKETLTEKNVWTCLSKKVVLDSVPSELIADISADSKYWLYINGKNVVFEGSVKRGDGFGYYDSVDVAPYLNVGENSICALVWFWGSEKNYSYNSSGQGGFIFEAISEDLSVISDSTWKVKRNDAYVDSIFNQPNYRLPEYSIHYDARKELGDWLSAGYDSSTWENATEYDRGGEGPYGKLYSRGIPMLKDYGLKDYENSKDYENYTVTKLGGEKITVDIPYNAQFTPYLKVVAPAGKKIKIT